MMLDLTQNNIDEGKPSQGSCCALALAFRDSGFPDGRVYATGFYSTIGISNGPMFKHTKATRKFMQDFDHGRPVKPHRFRIPGLVKP